MVRLLLEARADANEGDLSPLVRAARQGDADVVGLLVKQGAKVDMVDKDGTTAFYHAVARDGRIARMLLEARADVNKGSSPLVRAAEKGDVDMVALLAKRVVDINAVSAGFYRGTALYHSAGKDVRMARALLEARADINKGSSPPLVRAAEQGDADVAGLLVEHGADIDLPDSQDKTALYHAVEKDGPVARLLLEARADVNQGSSPLICAAAKGNVHMMTLLMERGVDINAMSKPSFRDKEGTTALYHAVGKDIRMARLLLEARADVNKGSSPLVRAASQGGWDMVSLLLDVRADVRRADSSSLLEQAVKHVTTEEQVAVVRLLLDSGANSTDAAIKSVQRAIERCSEDTHRGRLDECLALLEAGGTSVVFNLTVGETAPGSAWSVAVSQMSGNSVLLVTVDPSSTTVQELQAAIAERTSVAPRRQHWVSGGEVLATKEAALASSKIGSFLNPGPAPPETELSYPNYDVIA
jgi:ankyrin repeat protein